MNNKIKKIALLVLATTFANIELSADEAAGKITIPNADNGPSYEIAIAGEYFLYNRTSDFLGIGEAGKAASKLKGGLAGAGIRFSPLSSDSKTSFELNYKEGTIKGTPTYALSPSFSLGSDISDKRKEIEVGAQYYLGTIIKSLRYGYFHLEEA